MLRTARRIAPLLRSLVFSGATAVAAATLLTGMVGCADENDPMTHVERLDDPSTRSAAVKRIIQFFEDAMTRDEKNREGPTVKPLLDKIVEPMAKACVSGDLDERTQSNLVKFLSDARDPRAEPCFVKTLKEYKPDGNEEDVRWVARAVGPMKMKAAGEPMLQVFSKLRPSKPKADAIYRDVHDAMVDLADPSMVPQLIALVGRPIADRKDGMVLKDEMFWQITAAEMLGNLKSAEAVKPLLKLILSPMKVEAGNTALMGLIKIGKASIAPTAALLAGTDTELVEYSKVENVKAGTGPDGKPSADAQKAAATAHLTTATAILCAIGRTEGIAPVLDAIGKAPDDTTRALMARELVNLPNTPEVKKAFQDAFDKTPASLSTPLIGGAREALLDKATWFFDASMVPWMVKTAKDTKGDAEDVDALRTSTLLAAIKLMRPDQVALVDELATMKTGQGSEVGKAVAKELGIAKQIVSDCKENVECYLAKLAEPASQAKETRFQGIKAVYMVGVLGNEGTRDKILATMPKLTTAETLGLAGVVIDHFSPKGDPKIAAAFQKMIDDAATSKSPDKIANTASLKQVTYRLEARAQ